MFNFLIPPLEPAKKKALADMIYTLLSFIEMYHDQIKMNMLKDEELQALASALGMAFQNPRIAKKLIKAYFPDAKIISNIESAETPEQVLKKVVDEFLKDLS